MESLKVHSAIDVMHLAKNLCVNLIDFLEFESFRQVVAAWVGKINSTRPADRD